MSTIAQWIKEITPTPTEFEYKKAVCLEKRKKESARVRTEHPRSIPIIVQRVKNTSVPKLEKNKYLVPYDLTMSQFVYIIRKKIKLPPETGIFIFINNTLPPASALISQIHKDNKDEDGFLYMTYSGENAFG